jgi:ribose 1,5-bisphosphate isomerase
MEIRGAGRIARSAAAALATFASKYEGGDVERFRVEISEAASLLLRTRPTAISLTNAVKTVLVDFGRPPDVESLKEQIITRAGKFVRDSREAVKKIGEQAPAILAAQDVSDGATPSDAAPSAPRVLMTICNSSAAISAIIHCHRAGMVKMVYACETRPRKQGLITSRELSKAGVPVTLMVDSAMRYVMPAVDTVFVGSDTVESDGSVINKIGTGLLAATARDFGVPVYACAETYKFLPHSRVGDRVEIEERSPDEIRGEAQLPSDVEIFNPVFERVSPDLVTGIITEKGVVEPAEAMTIIEKYLGEI